MTIEIVDFPTGSMVIFHSFLMFFVCLPEGKIEMAIAILLWQKMYIKYIHILLGCRPVHHLKISQVSWENMENPMLILLAAVFPPVLG